MHPCIEADAEERTEELCVFDGYYPKWRYADEERQKGDQLLKKSFFLAYKKYSRHFIKF